MSQNIFITGATTGFGTVVAQELVKHGHHVLVAARNDGKAKALIEQLEVEAEKSGGSIDCIQCNLSSLESVKKTSKIVHERFNHLDQLINNAGVWHSEFTETVDGIEDTLQVNVIAPYMLMIELKDLLTKSDSPKVINTASALHMGEIQFNDLEFREGFSGFKAYRQSKLSIILLTRLFAKREYKIRYYAQHPGVVNTDLGRHLGGWANLFFKSIGVSQEKGATTLLHLALSNNRDLENGEYYAKSKPKRITKQSYDLESAVMLENEIRQRLNGSIK